MIARARLSASQHGYTNTTFVHSLITSIPLPDGIADCISSNCVINLVPLEEKPKVFREVYRLLKPGGRVSVSDILARKELSKEIREDAMLLVGCVAGAETVGKYEGWLGEAGFRGE